MLGFAWLTLRQAQEALKTGRLEEAQRLLSLPATQGHKRSWELLQQVARRYLERGEKHLKLENVEAAWDDLLRAEQVGEGDTGADRLRLALVRLGIGQVRATLEAGEPGRALDAITRLRERRAQQDELTNLEEAARDWVLARELADRGEFPHAADRALDALRRVPGQFPTLDRFRRELDDRQQRFGPLLLQLHEAAEQSRWRDVMDLSQQVLVLAPQHKEARRIRSLAWKAVEPVTVAMRGPEPARRDEAEEPAGRFLLWFDGVGGYLVCLGNHITFGQATPDAFVDVPLFADVSRLHATLTRDSEGYLLQASRPVQVNGQSVERVLLKTNDRVTLGACCQFQFKQPSPLSSTARLDLVSGHRLPLAVDAVLLMADTLVLGPAAQVHVAAPELKKPIVLYRHKDGLGVRYAGGFTVNGKQEKDRAVLGSQAIVSGEDFSFAIEPAGTRMGRS